MRVMLGLALACAVTAPAFAQEKNVGSFWVGYDYTRITAKRSGVWETLSKGIEFGAAKRVARGISLVASGSFSMGPNIASSSTRENQSPSRLATYTGGVEFSSQDASPAVRPFADFFYGGAHDNATEMNHFSAMFVGGGVDLKISKHLAFRVYARMPMLFFFGPVHLGYQAGFNLVMPVTGK